MKNFMQLQTAKQSLVYVSVITPPPPDISHYVVMHWYATCNNIQWHATPYMPYNATSCHALSCHGMRAAESSNKPRRRRPTLMIMSGALPIPTRPGARKKDNKRTTTTMRIRWPWHGMVWHAPPSNGLGRRVKEGREGTPLLLLLLPTEFGCEDPKVW